MIEVRADDRNAQLQGRRRVATFARRSGSGEVEVVKVKVKVKVEDWAAEG